MTTGTADATVSGEDQTRPMLGRADQLLAAGRADEAAVLLRGVTREHPDDAWAWQRLAAALLATNSGPEADREARDAADQGVRLDPSSAIGYRMLSEAALRLGDPDAALSTMRAAVHAAPDSWVAHLDLAAALMERPDGGREAWRIARRAAALASDRPEPHLMLGDLALRAGDLSHAAAGYADALDRDPGNGIAVRKLAELHHRMGEPAPASRPGDHHAARLFGNGLTVLAGLTVLTTGMLLALAPTRTAGWFAVVAMIAAGGLVLVGATQYTGVRRLADRWPGGPGYRVGLGIGGLCTAGAVLTVVVGALVADGTGPLRVALCAALAGCAAAHLTARFADRAARPVGDDRSPELMRSGAYLGLALRTLLHAVVYVALALLAATLSAGAFQLVAVLVTVALIFVTGVQTAALAGLGATHRRRFGWPPHLVLVTLAGSGLVDAAGATGSLASLFVPAPGLVLLVAAFAGFVLAAAAALAAANLRS